MRVTEELATVIIDALGLPKGCTRLSLTLEAGQPPRVEAQFVVVSLDPCAVEKIEKTLRRMKLVEE